MNATLASRLAVCSWSLQPKSPGELIERLRQVGLQRVQIALDPLRDDPAQWSMFGGLAAAARLQIVSGMFGCVGEDYSTLESIRQTGGVVPDQSWEENWRRIQSTAQLAADMGIRLVSFHAGFLPHDSSVPADPRLLRRLEKIADCFAGNGLELALETGQERAPDLAEFLTKLARKNVGVNFDPANMILYDKGDPIEALRVLGPFLKQVHIKDARRTRVPGTWGEEVPVGAGEVGWPEFFRTLSSLNFTGDCCIEREAGTQRVADIRTARERVETLAG